MRANATRVVQIITVALLCSGCGPGTLQGLLERDDLTYSATCRSLAQKHSRQIKDLAYNPPTLRVLKWPKSLAGGKNATMTEQEFTRQLAAGRARRVLVTARGGVGKSTLSKSLQSTLCGKLPTFWVDLAADVAPHITKGSKDNLILKRLAAKLGLPASEQAQFHTLLGQSAFVVLLDSLDEVPLEHRATERTTS